MAKIKVADIFYALAKAENSGKNGSDNFIALINGVLSEAITKRNRETSEEGFLEVSSDQAEQFYKIFTPKRKVTPSKRLQLFCKTK